MDIVTERQDAVLVTAALAGDATAVGEIYERYADRVYSFCLSRLRNGEQAADATHETFVRAAQRLDSLREPRKLRSWLFAIARNQIVDQARQRERSTSLEAAGDVTADLPDHDADLMAADSAQLLWEAAGSLQDRDLDLLELQLRQGLEGEDLADAMGVTTSHLHVLQSRMKDRIEKALGSLLIARHGRDDCERLSQLLEAWDGRFTLDVRSQVTRHIKSCEVCTETQAAVLVPGRYLGVLPLVAAPVALRARTAAAMEQALGMTGPISTSSASKPASGSDHGGDVSHITPARNVREWSWRDDGFPMGGESVSRRSALWWLSLAAGLLIVIGLAITAATQLGGGDEAEVASEAAPPASPTSEPAIGATAEPDPAIVPATPEPTATTVPTTIPTPIPQPTPTAVPTSTPEPTSTPAPVPVSTSTPVPVPTSTSTATPVPLTPGSIQVSSTIVDLAYGTAATVTLSNPGDLPVAWTATTGSPFSVAPAGEVNGGDNAPFTVSFDPTRLREGTYQDVVTISWSSGSATVNVSAQVDRTAPEVIRVSQPGQACTRSPIAMAVLVRDDPDIASVVVNWTSSDSSSGSSSLSPAGGGSFTGDIGPINRRSTVTAVATATDLAGNTGTGTTTFSVTACLGFSN